MTTVTVNSLLNRLQSLSDPDHASQVQRYFKTGKGEYGEGDLFLGIRMPVLRQLVKEFHHTKLPAVLKLLGNPWHEARLLALLLLVHLYQKGGEEEKTLVCRAFLENTRYINNWDLVDCSSHLILGPQLAQSNHELLYQLARSNSLWERRIAVMATFHFIRTGVFAPTLALCTALLQDQEDLIHKACGWMLREIGKRDLPAETAFLDRYCEKLPRTMLRYAIEKFPVQLRLHYLHLGKCQD